MQRGELRQGNGKTMQETSLRKYIHQPDDRISLVILTGRLYHKMLGNIR